jgi:hypothetical protein
MCCEWQQKQLAKEKAEEAQLRVDMVCGLVDYVIPRTTNNKSE